MNTKENVGGENALKESQLHPEAVRKLFSETSEEYATLFLPKKTGKNFIFLKRLALATATAREVSGGLFDCATGSGEITAAALAAGNFQQATVLDLSANMLELSSTRIKEETAIGKRAGAAEFVCDNFFHFAPLNSERKYDLILCLGLIAHTGRLPELLTCLRKMLSPNGVILLQTTLLDHPGTRIERALSSKRYFQKHGYWINYFNKRDIEAAVAEVGLKIKQCRRFGLGVPFGDRVWAWGNYHLERLCRGLTGSHGAEAIYVISANVHA